MGGEITRFAYLMDRTGIRAGELAEQTGIDKTLISRWKTGQRRLSASSSYTERIAECLLAQEKAASLLERTLLAYGLDKSTGALKENLVFWLSEQDMPAGSVTQRKRAGGDDDYAASFHVFLGKSGLVNAIGTMIDYVMSRPAGDKNVVAVIRGNSQWFTGNPMFLQNLVERMSIAFPAGVTLTVVSKDRFSVEEISAFSGPWLGAHLRGYIKSYYYEDEEPETDEKIIMGVEGCVALCMKHDPLVPDGIYVGMFTDDATVRQVYHKCKTRMETAQPLFKYGFLDKPGNFLKTIGDEHIRAASCYCIAHEPSFGTLTPARVHHYAQTTRKESRQRTQELSVLFQTPRQCEFSPEIRHVYCMESVEELLTRGRHPNAALSQAYGRRVNHSQKGVIAQLESIADWMESCPNYHAVFVPARIFDQYPMNIYSVQGLFTVAWLREGNSTCVRNQNKTDALFGFAGKLWEDIPQIYKNRKKTVNKIKGWLETVK